MPMSPRLLRPRQASGFDPRQISGLLSWYDVSDLSTLAQNSNGTTAAVSTNDPVGYVADKGPNGYHMTQATNNNRPLLELSAQSGRPAILFDGLDDFLTNATTYLNGSRPTIFAVCQRQGNGASLNNHVQCPISSGRGGASAPEVWCSIVVRNTFAGATANTLQFQVGNSSTTSRRNGTASLDTGTSPTSFFIAAGVAGSTSVNVVNAADGTQLGILRDGSGVLGGTAASSLNFRLHGRIGEVIVYNRVLSSSEIAAVEQYLSGKWGITLT